MSYIHDDGGPLYAPPMSPAMTRTVWRGWHCKVGQVTYSEPGDKTRVGIVGLEAGLFIEVGGDQRHVYHTGERIEIEDDL